MYVTASEARDYVTGTFWSEWFWFGGSGHSWSDFVNKPDGVYHPQYSDLRWALLTGVVIFIIRQVLER